MKTFLVAITLMLSVVLFGCSTFRSVDGNELAERFETSANNSAVSWWYLGETKYYYLLAEKRPGKVTTFRVGRENVRLIGVSPFLPGMKESVRLKKESFQFE